MTETPAAPQTHATPYGKVFVALLLLTVLEYFYAMAATRMDLAFPVLVGGLLAMALTKAVLVAMFFMHVKYEGRWVYFLIVPSVLMATIVVAGIYPDIGRTHPTADAVAR
ncbi:MAG: cytochrome C oxidase subunit IV family protein [Isosphaeraceae bacterium]